MATVTGDSPARPDCGVAETPQPVTEPDVNPVIRLLATVSALALATVVATPGRAEEPASGTSQMIPPAHTVAPAPAAPMPAPATATQVTLPAATPPPQQAFQPAAQPVSQSAITVYSRETGEKLAFTGLDYADHFISMLGIGVGTGALVAAATGGEGSAYAVGTSVGAVAYTMPSLALILTDRLDRGDLPLIALLSSAPVYALLFPTSKWRHDAEAAHNRSSQYGSYAYTSDAPSSVYWAIPAVAGGVGFITANLLATHLRFDPGDMQWLRDMTFWGGLLGAGVAGVVNNKTHYADQYTTLAVGVPSGMALGLVAGFLGAHYGEFSYERTYFASLAGYAGTLAGGALGALSGDGAWVIGSAAGFAALSFGLTFGLTSVLDKIPDDAVVVDDSTGPVAFLKRTNWLQPAMLPYVNELGQQQSGFGLKVAEGRW